MSSVVLNESKIWITGGWSWSNNDGSLKSTEIISLNQPPVLGPDLPFTVSSHCMVLVNPTTIYLIGGIVYDKKTWIIDPTNDFQIKEGPSLNIERIRHSCSKMRINGRIFLVVAGGLNKESLEFDSVELLDTTCPDRGWKKGIK